MTEGGDDEDVFENALQNYIRALVPRDELDQFLESSPTAANRAQSILRRMATQQQSAPSWGSAEGTYGGVKGSTANVVLNMVVDALREQQESLAAAGAAAASRRPGGAGAADGAGGAAPTPPTTAGSGCALCGPEPPAGSVD